MSKNLFKKLMIVSSVLLLLPMIDSSSFALAKRRKSPPRAYSFIVEGGKASQGECDGERKIPRRLKHIKEFAKTGSYMGSELQTPEIKGKDGEEMWKHFYRVKTSCNTALGKTPSALDDKTAKAAKPELPPDDSEETDDSESGPESGNMSGPDSGAESSPENGPDNGNKPEQADGPDTE